MQQGFENLTDEQRDILYDVIPAITYLIASADGEFDETEAHWAKKITHIRSYTHHADLGEFYQEVEKRFEKDLNQLIKTAPEELSDKIDFANNYIEKADKVIGKLDEDTAAALYKDLLSFAKHVAKSSGGFFKFGAISPQERKYLNLDKLTPRK